MGPGGSATMVTMMTNHSQNVFCHDCSFRYSVLLLVLAVLLPLLDRGAPRSFESFTALFAGQRGADLQGDSDPQLQILNKLNEEFPGRVDAVSYDARSPRSTIS